MKAKVSVFASFVVGAVLASLPYTLSSGSTHAQAAGPAGQGGPPPAQAGGGQFGGGPGQPGFQRGQGFPGQGQPMGSPMVNSMTTAGNFLFVAAGDTIYKIRIDTMAIDGQTKLPAPRMNNNQLQPGQRGGGGLGQRGGGTPPPTK